jgi:hypothetical protein
MPYNFVQSIKENAVANWNALPPKMQYAISMALAGASAVFYEAVSKPQSDWKQVVSDAIRAAVVALICHRLPTPASK